MPTAALLRRATRNLAAIGAPAPLRALLGPARRRALEQTLASARPEVERLEAALDRGDERARVELSNLADRALGEMRRRVASAAAEHGGALNWAASMDEWWCRTEEGEYLDDPDLDESVRIRIVSHLDDMNELLGSYGLFFERMRPFLCDGRPTKVLDLAAGHGGFALAIAELSRREGLSLEVVASDLKEEYLALGRARAERTGVDVRFAQQDALDLTNFAPAEFDVVTSTQALHHFSAGQIAVMFAEAVRVAARGVLFIDGARSALTAAATWALGVFGYRDTAFAHDSLISFRRFFVPEELELLGRLVPRGERARAEAVAPGHCVLALAQV